MRLEFTHKENSGKLILIFAGWSTGPQFYSDIKLPGWDTLVAYGYDDLSFPTEILSRYTTVALFAWSMGVYAAAVSIPPDSVSLAIAVNGTENPVSDSHGIPCDIFRGTADTLSERNLLKFQKRMAGDAFGSISGSLTCHDIPALKAELLNIIDNCSRLPGENYAIGRLRWHRVYISSSDRIFPPANQTRSWEGNPFSPEIISLDAPHFIPLLPIIKAALPSCDKIGSRFHKALPTYDGEASAQRTIARHLADLCPPGKRTSIVEIGPGSGIFTNMIAGKFSPDSIDFIDLYPLPDFGIEAESRYHVADAEEWIERESNLHPHSRDAVLAASSIQWFANPRRFFKNAARLLRPGGILACSTFLPGNLSELKAVNPYGLVYRSVEETRDMTEGLFSSISLHEETITLSFPSPRHTLLHLRNTGVGGNASTGLSMRELSSRLPSSLSYRPLYIIAVNGKD